MMTGLQERLGGDVMRRLMLVLALIGCCFSLSGCWFFDAEHNRGHWKIIKKDLRAIHQDLNFILALETETTLADDRYR